MSEPQRARENREIIDGRWAVVGPAKSGGMASVVEAFDLSGEFGQVAIKRLPPASDDAWRRAAFEHEQEALAQLGHPNIVRLLFSGRDETSGQRYLVFPWYPTRLQDHMREAGAIPWPRWWLDLGRPILSALEVIHRQDIVHRDLKPANVLLDRDQVPVIIDFGIAKLRRRLAPERTVAGESPPFTPPETSTPLKYMATRDIHAWAALTAFAVSGDDPYPDPEPPAAEIRAAALETARSRMPPAVTDVLTRCLDAEPSRRPLTGGVLLADIEGALAVAKRAHEATRSKDAPIVHLHLTRRARDNLEAERDLWSAEVDELVEKDLEEERAVLQYAGESDQYVIVGTELSLRAAIDENGERLVIVNAVTLPDSTLERERIRGWPGPMRFSLAPAEDRVHAAEAISYLRREVALHTTERRSEEQRRRRARPLAVWRTLLALLRSLEVAQEDPLAYRAVRLTSRGIAFELARGLPPPDLVGQRRLAPCDTGTDFVADIVAVREREIMARSAAGDRHDVLGHGELRLDTHAATTAIDRQQRSLDAVEYGRARRPDLVTLLTQPASVRAPRPILGLTFSPGLDKPKQGAIEAALGSDDILLVQGPPGTGKTRFISELVVQTLNRDPDTRILISSQAHAALDNALTEVHGADPTIRLLRVARTDDDRVDPMVGELLLERSVEAWAEQVVRQGNAWLRRWATQKGVVVADVEGAMRLRELAAHLDLSGELSVQLAEGEAELERLRVEVRRASAAATATTVIRERAAELVELREGIRSAEAKARDELARLVEIDKLPAQTRLRGLSADGLRTQANALLPADEDAARQCEQLIELLADWHSRFGADPAFAAAALLRSQVVAATCVGLGGISGIEKIPFDLCIVDEASRATATELLIPMASRAGLCWSATIANCRPTSMTR